MSLWRPLSDLRHVYPFIGTGFMKVLRSQLRALRSDPLAFHVPFINHESDIALVSLVLCEPEMRTYMTIQMIMCGQG